MVPRRPALANWGRQAGLSSMVGVGRGGGGGSVTGEGLYLGQWGDIAHSGIEMPVSNYLCSTWR